MPPKQQLNPFLISKLATTGLILSVVNLCILMNQTSILNLLHFGLEWSTQIAIFTFILSAIASVSSILGIISLKKHKHADYKGKTLTLISIIFNTFVTIHFVLAYIVLLDYISGF